MASTSVPMSSVIYIKHIPDGFFESQMTDYFNQFGKVNRVKMARSLKTGRSKGFGFVDFQDVEVARIAAKTMNNYLMFEKKLQCKQIPASELKASTFKFWNKGPYVSRQRSINARRHNKIRTEEQVDKMALKTLRKLRERNRKLKAAGVDYQFKVPQNKRRVKEMKEEIKKEEPLDESLIQIDTSPVKGESFPTEDLELFKVKSEPESEQEIEKSEKAERNQLRKTKRKKIFKNVPVLKAIPKFKGTGSLGN